MAVTIRPLDGGLGALESVVGTVDGQQFVRAQADYLLPARLACLRYWLADLTDVDVSHTTSGEIQQLVDLQLLRLATVPELIVAVIAHLDVSFGMVRMWQIRLEARGASWEIRAFRTRPEAEEWLRERMRDKHGVEITLA